MTHSNQPDIYESFAGIKEVNRTWKQCVDCGHFQQEHNYDVKELKKVYTDDYRDKEFRGETIKDAFDRIISIPGSENSYRVHWFLTNYMESTKGRSLLDVGSGIGVFPYLVKCYSAIDVYANEINKDSLEHLKNIGLKLEDEHEGLFDIVSIIHVLEHVVDPIKFLSEFKNRLRYGGTLFIEVPDALEFECLEKGNDEFNSCHLHFFTINSLVRMIESCGFKITDLHRAHYRGRNLKRIMLLARNGGFND
jgi:SAM-dependent methyltransferase